MERQLELWFTENQTEDVALGLRIQGILHQEQTKYQNLAVLDTVAYGRMLVLDGAVQTTERDEFAYHEMITHVPLQAHPRPRRIAIVGGGDGGAVREILKDPAVEKVVLIEIDEAVTRVAQRFLPSIASGLGDPRVEIRFEDGIQHMQEHKSAYDVVIIDSTDPVGPASGLFQRPFYQSVYEALADDGIMVAQTESPFLEKEILQSAVEAVRAVFPRVYVYLGVVPTYPSGLWSFTLGSKKYDPTVPQRRPLSGPTRYYNFDLHTAAFTLPNFVRDLIAG
ncbi:MAG: polyamine aminopropyltransferase [Limnochordales bacterium]|nr:polyamine aminopropyltransferase [Limnochordales bacterium]